MKDRLTSDSPSEQGTPVIRVLITDDSPLIGDTLARMLSVTDIQVVGQATSSQEAVRMAMRLRPDVITMDIQMPRMDALEATRQIMRVQPTPIVVLASAAYASDYNIAFDAIDAGALTVIEKPKGLGVQGYEAMREQLLAAIRLMAGVKVVALYKEPPRADGIGPMTAVLHSYFIRSVEAIGIAAAIGGPPVLMQILSSLPQDFAIPIVIVQQIVPTFIGGLAEWLNSRTHFNACVAADGDKLESGKVLIAPGGAHLTVTADKTIRLDPSDPINQQRPSATRLFESMAQAFGASAIGIILSGTGDDGVEGLERMSKAGAYIIAQDEASSTDFDMPGAAIQRGIVDEILSPDEIATRLTKLDRHTQSQRHSQQTSAPKLRV
jgi:two-component system chemotaxis response regulator CheB